MRYSFDAIDIKDTCDRLQDGPSYLQITAQINVTKRKLLILIKNSIASSCVSHKLFIVKDNVSIPGAWNKSKELPKVMKF